MATYQPELLAPAKNKDYGIAAINHGADAVYIAAHKFGAREAAGNSLSDIEQLVTYAHRYYAKVYVTLNTILYEQELEDARRIAIQAYELGADALIVQDMALLEMDLPPIALHASTQANSLTADKVKFLADVGFSRVILGRELSIKEIADIHSQTSVELEAFVHGALCVSHSGQCYLSQSLTGRSANRGACAQPCRSSYDLYDANGKLLVKDKHLLSLRDLNLSDRLEDLYQSGICSFKIEGRLKDLSYVKNVTAYYRKKLDELIAKTPNAGKASSGKVFVNFEPKPELSFSRGFTSYFANGKQSKIASIHTPKAIGERLGKVQTTGKTWFTLNSNANISNGDGICFFDLSEKLQGVRINRVENERLYPLSMESIVEGVEIFRSFNQAFEKVMEGHTADRLVSAQLTFSSNENNISITATDEDGVTACIEEPQTGEPAKNIELAKNNLLTGFSKSGDSMFIFTASINTDKPYFYPHSVINTWRRKLIALLEKARLEAYKRTEHKVTPNTTPYPTHQLSYLGNVANSLARKFYQQHGVDHISEAFELQQQPSAALMTTHYCIRRELGMCAKGVTGGNAEPLFLLNNGKRLKVIFDCERCGMRITRC